MAHNFFVSFSCTRMSKHPYQVQDFSIQAIKDITVEKMNKFVAYMRRQGIDHGKGEVSQSIRNRLTHICAVIRYINAKGIELKNPFGKGGVIIPPAKRSDVFLTDKELGRLVRLYLNGHLNKTEHRVLTMYLFSCATGICSLDLPNYTPLQFLSMQILLLFSC